MTSTWKNRIVGYGEDKPENLLANPKNWRRHPAEQQDALAGAMREVGYVQAVIVNRSTGFLVDGHCRVEQAMRAHQESIPVVYVELSKEDEAKVLATLDPLGAMASRDDAALTELLREVQTDDPALIKLLGDLGADAVLAQAEGPEQGESMGQDLQVIVNCADRRAQETLLARLNAEGYQCQGKG